MSSEKTTDLKELLFTRAAESVDKFDRMKSQFGWLNSTVQRLHEHSCALVELIKEAGLYEEYLTFKYGEDEDDNVPDWRT